MILLGEKALFPSLQYTDPDGLVAIGGDMTLPWLERAYSMGIFPWYDSEPILWWSPDPRFVLFPEQLTISKSLQKTIDKKEYVFTVDTDFSEVMKQCQQVKRKHESGTWIQDEMIVAYSELFEKGKAHCAAIYQDGKLVAGLYGLSVGRVFCGESMFHHVRDMSKVCFVLYTQYLSAHGIELIDCQVYTKHLSSLGAVHIPREVYISYLDSYDSEGRYRGEVLEL